MIEKMKEKYTPIRVVFAKNVKTYRNILRYSQEKLAEKTDLSVQSIKDIEACRQWISDHTLSKIAKALKISEFQLFLPENSNNEENFRKTYLKSIILLKENLKTILDDQFEDALNTENFGKKR